MRFLTSILVLIIVFTIETVSAQKQTITATVVNVTSNKGKVSYALYNKDNFMKEPVKAKSSKIVNGKSTVVFDDVPAGEYAIVCYHDKNNNNKMDFQPNGMPIENYGASNNVMNFGPPQYEDAKFTIIDNNVSLEIRF
ncbi:Uncharacterized conserved protein, DUF2141 family [Tenacibaculum sp. MAR_2010_89]|uniref:DUF2141 domain-containing protein n=1 Tax=Tenacibaculum sp. MAR_2010_89 TaxID=1250198 RepID=UPI0008945295|nr:DUF2141 domain-containing protein [Tenacibaculum sp. MAR_2010_89]SEE44469.1 Uncharacterized conserved protein, DUF2141 family [Tenacibaculum sp. MAR_2010_89]